MTLIDITDEYLKQAKSKSGMLIIEEGYSISMHADEVKAATWLHDTIGGNITLLAETDSVYFGKRPDYIWNGKYWELKKVYSVKAVDAALRKALQQIRDNPGGVIIDLCKSRESIQRLESAIRVRLQRSCKHSIDLIICRNDNIMKVVRYK
nr:hypothetical protein [Clostridia bacterium]